MGETARVLLQDVMNWMADNLSVDQEEWQPITIEADEIQRGDDLLDRLAVALGHMTQEQADEEKAERDARWSEYQEQQQSQRKQDANWKALADGLAPPYPSEY